MITFASPTQRQRAEQLMQPTLIRVIDNLRQALETSSWRGTYEEQPLWPPGTPESTKNQVQQLLAQLATVAADSEAAATLQAQLRDLPQPYPAYQLHLQRTTDDQLVQVIDVWDLCCQVCLDNYHPAIPAKVDASLLEADGDIDWLALDEKAKELIQAIFQRLPHPPGSSAPAPSSEA